MKILLVEDDQSTRTLLQKTLAVHHYSVEVAVDGQSALNFAEKFEYDLILLDVGIPELDGISVCKRLRTHGCQIPILLLTAKDGATDRVLGLDAGADDYMVKPFHLPELLARMRALLRRGRTTGSSIVTWGELQLDCIANQIYYGDRLLRFTPKEYGILELLLLHPHRIFSRSAILDRLWELDDAPTESAISSHIKAIRQKLRAAGATQDWIETMYGFGYRLRPLQPATPTKTDKTEEPSPAPKAEFSPDAAKAVMLELWERFKDSFTEQIGLVGRVVTALHEGTLTAELRQQAKQTVHKLAGSLGVYGFPQGSTLARQIEELLLPETDLDRAEIQRLSELVTALQQEINREPKVATSAESIARSSLILLVDHDKELAERLKVEASKRSLQLEVASTLTAAQQFIDRTLPDLVLLDLTFSNISNNREDSLTWLETLRQNHPNLTVLIFTGRDSLLDRLAVSRLGAKQFLHKPVTTEQIFHAIQTALRQTNTSVLPTRQTPEAKVLIVDDDPIVLAHHSALLTPWGLEIITLAEPQRFWEVLTSTQPDLVILDLEMPKVNGLELCQVVRQDVQWGNLPILVVTAHTDIQSLQKAFAAGADDFIPKPVIGPELVTRVISRIERNRLRDKSG